MATREIQETPVSRHERPSLYLLNVDETSATQADGLFFIVGGLVFTPEQAVTTHEKVQRIRDSFGFAPKDSFKFQTASRPKTVSIDDFRVAKSSALALIQQLRIPMVAYVVLHDIATAGPAENTKRALNAVLSHFNYDFLRPTGGYGMVAVDRLSESYSYEYMKSKYSSGLTLLGGRTAPLDRIMQLGFSADGMSHLASLVDIALGSFRYCVNAAFGLGKVDVAQSMMRVLGGALWHQEWEDGGVPGWTGYIPYPKDVRHPAYKEKYDLLEQRLADWAASHRTIDCPDGDVCDW